MLDCNDLNTWEAFQSTLPAGGATAEILSGEGLQKLFQSTLPAGGATGLIDHH